MTAVPLNRASPQPQSRESPDDSIDALLRAARTRGQTAWAWYRVGEQLHLAAQGTPDAHWPASIADSPLDAFCTPRRLHRWPTGSGESVLGWLLAPAENANYAPLAELANDL